ncbi:PSPB protein, partial [Machaerirhynchus nigripectus]|nr:PSPB protein [Machaerirhynchus nigripectus]
PPGWVLTVATGLGAPGGRCGVLPSAWCQNWVTALRCGALGRCPHLTQGHPDVDVCALCQQLVGFLRHVSNQSAVEVVLDQVVGMLCLHLPFVATLCGALVRALVHRLLCEIHHLEPWQVCATVKLCHREPAAAPAVPIFDVPGTLLQVPGPGGSGGRGAVAPRAMAPRCRGAQPRAA